MSGGELQFIKSSLSLHLRPILLCHLPMLISNLPIHFPATPSSLSFPRSLSPSFGSPDSPANHPRPAWQAPLAYSSGNVPYTLWSSPNQHYLYEIGFRALRPAQAANAEKSKDKPPQHVFQLVEAVLIEMNWAGKCCNVEWKVVVIRRRPVAKPTKY